MYVLGICRIPQLLAISINEVCPGVSTGLVGQSYLGNSIGSVSAFTAGWLAKRFGGPFHVAPIGFIVMLGSLVLSLGDLWMLIEQVFVMCLGMFVIYTLAYAEVTHNARSLGGVVNGPYFSCYFAGGASLCS